MLLLPFKAPLRADLLQPRADLLPADLCLFGGLHRLAQLDLRHAVHAPENLRVLQRRRGQLGLDFRPRELQGLDGLGVVFSVLVLLRLGLAGLPLQNADPLLQDAHAAPRAAALDLAVEDAPFDAHPAVGRVAAQLRAITVLDGSASRRRRASTCAPLLAVAVRPRPRSKGQQSAHTR